MSCERLPAIEAKGLEDGKIRFAEALYELVHGASKRVYESPGCKRLKGETPPTQVVCARLLLRMMKWRAQRQALDSHDA